MDLISICIPTYNGEIFIKKTLDSIKKQTYKNIELIISDDNSKDNTISIIEDFKKEVNFPVLIIPHTPAGIGANWNNCLSYASGIYIKFIFQDDFMEPTCLEEMRHCLIKTKMKVAICKRNIVIDNQYYKKNTQIEKWLSIYKDLQQQLYPLPQIEGYSIISKSIFSNIRFLEIPYNKIGEPIVGLLHKSVFEVVGKYNETIKQFLDYEFWYRALLRYDFALIDKPLVTFRIHFHQTTKINERNNLNEFPLYLKFVHSSLKEFINPKVFQKKFGPWQHIKKTIRKIFGKGTTLLKRLLYQ